jgi:hypothetical protein
MNPVTFLLLNLALAFYNVGTIWAHEVDIFRSWKLVDPDSFSLVQGAHWRKLPYWVFLPVGLALAGLIQVCRYSADLCARDCVTTELLHFPSA